jgi:hypothetical protein
MNARRLESPRDIIEGPRNGKECNGFGRVSGGTGEAKGNRGVEKTIGVFYLFVSCLLEYSN